MQLEKLDYIIAKAGEKDKPTLLRIRRIDQFEVLGVVPNEFKGTPDETTYHVALGNILTVLGPHPQPGKAFGIQTEPLYKQKTIKRWGKVFIYLNIRDEKIAQDLEKFYVRLEHWGRFFNDKSWIYPNFETHIRPPRGKIAGTYKYQPKFENDLLTFHPSSLTESTDHVITHEIGHNVYHRILSNTMRAKWIQLYQEHVNITKHEREKVKLIIQDLAKIDTPLQDYCDNLDEPELEIVEQILENIKKTHSLKRRHVENLVSESISLEPILPKPHEILIGEPQHLVSEYGSKNVEELFAEAWGHHFGKKAKLDPQVTKLLQETIKSLSA